MLRRAALSVNAQTHADIEHIVVTDSAAAAARALEGIPGIIIVESPRRGVYDAINRGIEAATGDIVGMVHGSDVLTCDSVVAQVADAFERDESLDFLYGDIRYVSRRNFRPGRIYHAAAFTPDLLAGGYYPPHPTLYIRRHVAQRVGPYTTAYRIAGDFDMWIRLFSDTSLRYRYLPTVMIDMTSGGISTSLRARLYENNYEKLQVLRSHGYKASPWRLFTKYWRVAVDLFKK